MNPQAFVENYRGGTIFLIRAGVNVYRWEERGIRQRVVHNRDLAGLREKVDKVRAGEKQEGLTA